MPSYINITPFLRMQDGYMIYEVFDVKVAFLEPYLNNEMYISCPKGIAEFEFIISEKSDSTYIHLE